MHAASVHPEPGSNSRSVCINTRCKQVLFPASRTNLFLLRAFALSFLYSLLSIVSLRIFEFRISHILSFSMLCTSSLFYCSFVKDRCPLSATACILYHVLPPLSRGFSKVFSTFFPPSDFFVVSRSRSSRQLVYSITFPMICQAFFDGDNLQNYRIILSWFCHTSLLLHQAAFFGLYEPCHRQEKQKVPH